VTRAAPGPKRCDAIESCFYGPEITLFVMHGRRDAEACLIENWSQPFVLVTPELQEQGTAHAKELSPAHHCLLEQHHAVSSTVERSARFVVPDVSGQKDHVFGRYVGRDCHDNVDLPEQHVG
jgi:hypothetical protein